jgi:hypothetical protein
MICSITQLEDPVIEALSQVIVQKVTLCTCVESFPTPGSRVNIF